MTYQEYADSHSRALFELFAQRLKPLLAEVAPDWLLHHIELRRRNDEAMEERVEIRLVIKPIGSARFASDTPELRASQLLIM